MKIKNAEELANVLGMAFRVYCARVAEGRGLDVYLPFIDGAEYVEARIYLKDSVVTVKPFPTVTLAEQPEPIIIKESISEPVLEAQPTELIEETKTEVVEEVEKPKRKRKS